MLQCFEFHDKHGRNRRKERICFDHEQVRDQNKCVLTAAASENSKRGQLFRGVAQPRCVVGPRVSPAYFKLTAWIAANVYAYVHGHTRTHYMCQSMRISSKTLSTSSLTINAPLIVKDEVDIFELILSATKQKILCGLKAYCYLGPACPGALKGPRTGGSMITILIE